MNPYNTTTTTGGGGSDGGGAYHNEAEEDPSNYPEIDLNKYPPPKDSTKKIRGKSALLEFLIGGLEPELVVAKGFYFFFYASFGSLFPLMGVYYKQLGLNGAQAGILSGIRPIIEFIAAPLWVEFAQRKNKTRLVMLSSLVAWIMFTFPLAIIQPETVYCLTSNKSNAILIPAEAAEAQYRRRRDIKGMDDIWLPDSPQDDIVIDDAVLESKGIGQEYIHSSDGMDWSGNFMGNDVRDISPDTPLVRMKRKIPKELAGITPYKINEQYINYDSTKMSNLVSPSFSNLVFKKEEVGKVFFLILMLVIAGEACASPAIVIADSRVMEFLGDAAPERYGHQRMFGSLGWAIAMFFVGIALDQSKFPGAKCKLAQEKNYTVCFAIFVVLMSLATILAWKLTQVVPIPHMDMELMDKEVHGGYEGGYGGSGLHTSTSIEHTDRESGLPHSTVFAQVQRSKITEWINSVKHFKTPTCIGFLVVAWFMGIGIGLIFTFLFWHLQEFGGSPTVFGIASVINHISEIFAYFFSSTFISSMGHVKVLCMGLFLNVLRFLYISILSNPWWVLPFEFVQGLTHAAVWAACCSYLSHNTPPELRQPSQSMLHFLHHGLGRGFGAIVGGLCVSMYGTITTFRLYAGLCALGLGMFIFLNFYRKESGGFIRELPAELDPHSLAEETSVLAPHGVPGGGGGMQRVGSNIKLEEQQWGGSPGGGGGFNPFNQQQNVQDQSQQYFIR